MENLIERHCNYDICDYCVYYDYNGEDTVVDGEIVKGAVYCSKGYCNLLKERKEPENGCKHFICEICNPKFNKKIRSNK